MSKTLVSKKGQVVIPKDVRERLNLTPGTILEVLVEDKKVVLEPVKELNEKIFVHAGEHVTESIVGEAKATSDKTRRLLNELGIDCLKSS
jgi:AbrB family looped-hinge helix DNA binding protein